MSYIIDEEEQKFVKVFNQGDGYIIVLYSKEHEVPLQANQYRQLKRNKEEMTEKLIRLKENKYVDYKRHLGDNCFFYSKSPYQCVQVRYFHESDANDETDANDGLQPTMKGISLKFEQWFRLSDIFELIEVLHPEIGVRDICLYSHENQEDYFECSICCPNGKNSD